jgi:hypothetical protein
MKTESLLAALDATLESPSPPDLEPPDKFALAIYWLVDRLASALDIEPHAAALQVALAASTAADSTCDLEPDQALPGESGVH